MTKEDWQKLKDWWGCTFYTSFYLECDGHKISLSNEVYKMKVIIALYVDGWVKGEWLKKDHPIGSKFYPLIRKGLYTSKELKANQKVFGKKSEHAHQKYYEYVGMNWTSFAAFKKQLLSTCKEIKIIEE